MTYLVIFLIIIIALLTYLLYRTARAGIMYKNHGIRLKKMLRDQLNVLDDMIESEEKQLGK